MRARKTSKGNIIDLTDHCTGSINRNRTKRKSYLPAILILVALWALILTAIYLFTNA